MEENKNSQSVNTTHLQKPAHQMYFVALVCPAALDKKIRSYKNWMKENFGCVVALRSPAHITLVPPFWLEKRKQDLLLERLHTFKSQLGTLKVQVRAFGHFGKRVLFAAVAKSAELEQLKTQVESHFSTVFNKVIKEKRPFHPHITIANRDMQPSHFVQAWHHFSKQSIEETFYTQTISLLRHDGAKWVVTAENEW